MEANAEKLPFEDESINQYTIAFATERDEY